MNNISFQLDDDDLTKIKDLVDRGFRFCEILMKHHDNGKLRWITIPIDTNVHINWDAKEDTNVNFLDACESVEGMRDYIRKVNHGTERASEVTD